MPKLFFEFHDYDTEIETKMISQKISSSIMVEALYRFLSESGTNSQDIQKTKELFSNYLAGTAFDKEKPHYLSHPIRVTASYLASSGQFDYEAISLGLCHNLKEKSGDNFRQDIPDAYLSEKNKQMIELLTINRAQEEDRTYLARFYDAIANEPSVLLLKALDKLDNTLIWPLLDLEKYHADIILDFVIPRIEKSKPKLAKYLFELTKYVERPEVQKKFRALNQSESFLQKTHQAAR